DWEVPLEWQVREAWIKGADGSTVVGLRDHTLPLMSYSTPVRATMTLAELQPHLHSLPAHPDWIPHRTSYYRPEWGFCLTERKRRSLQAGAYEVRVDTSLTQGHLTYAECVVEGETSDEFLVFTHVCHPSLCNDNLTGIAIATQLAQQLRQQRPR